MKTYLPLLFLSLLLLFSGCKKNYPDPVIPKDDLTQLPPETQAGKNTFGCMVNGHVWRNQGQVPFGSRDLKASRHEDIFYVSARKKVNPVSEGMALHVLEKFVGEGIYNLNTDFFNGGKRFGLYNKFNSETNEECKYYTDTIHTGILEITHFDSVNYIVAGRFSFTVATTGCDTIRVTDGRFDIKYAY